ncbi:LacI family DNA-binding transcriptional regulator [Amycolatopsis sp. NPDC059090]|uniref:LacI family DNA-binding transcriptional regulator n=1 Tax=unclassified Amycolatopsis TaxID=2618356 RepID=UPI00367054B9
MANGKVTIYDVAQAAGVSIATVSQTLNRPGRVNARTRQRVLDVIDELGFVPKATAVSHARKAVGRVGAIAPFTTYDSFRRRLKGLLPEAQSQEREVVVYDQVSAAEAPSPLLSAVPVTQRLDGLIIMGLPLEDSLAERLRKSGLPTVLVDSSHPELSSVSIDDELGGYLAGRHLLERGRRRIGFVSEPELTFATRDLQGNRREAGLRRAIAEDGRDPASVEVHFTENSVSGGQAVVRELADSGRLPEALFAHHDALAAGILLECRHRGIAVPDDLAVIGFDNGDLAEALEITTIHQPLEESGRLGAKLLNDALADQSATVQHVLLPVRLVERATA